MIKVAAIAGCFILFDILTGFLKAMTNHTISSTALRKGLLHKLSEIVSIVFCFLCEYAIKFVDLNVSLPLVIAVSSYVIVMETISIIENIVEVNPDMLKFFQKYLNKMKGGLENDSEDDEFK